MTDIPIEQEPSIVTSEDGSPILVTIPDPPVSPVDISDHNYVPDNG